MLFEALFTQTRSQITLNHVKRPASASQPAAGESARTIRNFLTEEPALSDQREIDVRSFLSLKQNELRAAEAREMGLGPPDVVKAQIISAAQKLRRNELATIKIGIVVDKERDKYLRHKRFPLDADTDRLVALYRVEAKNMGLQIGFVADPSHTQAHGTLTLLQNDHRILPAAVVSALGALTDPVALTKLDPNKLDIGQGRLGTCYLWAAVIATARRSPQMFANLMQQVSLSSDASHSIANVQTTKYGPIPIRRSDYVRHFDERLICGEVGRRGAPGEAISSLIPPPALLLLELAEAEIRRQEKTSVVKGLGAVGGWSRNFLGNFLPGQQLWLDSTGGRSSNGRFEYSVKPFTDPDTIQRLENILKMRGNDPKVALMAATLLKVGDNDPPLRTSAGSLYRDHAYAVVNYEPKNKLVTLINPWDSEKKIYLDFKEFCQNFAVLEGFEFANK